MELHVFIRGNVDNKYQRLNYSYTAMFETRELGARYVGVEITCLLSTGMQLMCLLLFAQL
jgi:hypothetical protein